MDAQGTDQSGNGALGATALVLLDREHEAWSDPHPALTLTRREWKRLEPSTDLGGLPVVTWRTTSTVLAPIRRIHRRRSPSSLRRRVWFGVVALCLFTLGTIPW